MSVHLLIPRDAWMSARRIYSAMTIKGVAGCSGGDGQRGGASATPEELAPFLPLPAMVCILSHALHVGEAREEETYTPDDIQATVLLDGAPFSPTVEIR